MKKNYFLRSFIIFTMSLAFVLGNANRAYCQSISIYSIGSYGPIAKNIAPGSTNNRVASFGITCSENVTLHSITFPTAGTYTTGDIAVNGFKLWYANSYVSGDPIPSSTFIAEAAGVASGGNIVFSGLNLALPGSQGKLMHVTVDIDAGATVDNTINIASTPLTNFVFSSGTASGSAFAAQPVQTIGTPLPVIDISTSSISAKNVSVGSTELRLYRFSIEVTDADATMNSLTVPTKGTYTTSDIAANGFKLWHVENGTTTLVKSASAVVSGGNIVFAGLSELLQKDKYHYFNITVDLSSSAVAGHSLGIDGFSLSNLSFGTYQVLDAPDPFSAGPLHTVAIPEVNISSLPVAASSISPGSHLNVLYKLKVAAVNSGAAFTQLKFTTGGTYQVSDIVSGGFQLFIGDASDFNPDHPIASLNAVASGGDLLFNLDGTTIEEDDEEYIYLTVDLATSATSGRTIHIQAVPSTNLTIASGTVSGSGSAAGTKTIVIPSISFSNAGPAAKNISASTYVVLHSSAISVSGAPLTFESASFTLSGSYQASDFSSDDDVLLYYHKTADLFEEWNSGNSAFPVSEIPAMPASGSTLTFNYMPLELWGVNPTIPTGSGYLTVISKVGSAPVVGHTIQLTPAGISGYTFASGTKSGTTGAAGIQSITTPSIFVSGINIPASNMSPGSNTVIYSIQLDVSDANAILKEISLTTAGNYSSLEVYSFNFYMSEDLVFNEEEDHNMGYANYVSPGNALNTFVYEEEIPQGTSYLLLVVSTSSSATIGKTISIVSTPVNKLAFVSGVATGTTMAAGGTFTFAEPTSIALTFPVIPGTQIQSGSEDNVIYSFTITPEGSSANFNSASLMTAGTFDAADLEEYSSFKLYYNTSNSFNGSTNLRSEHAVNSGETVSFTGLDLTLAEDVTMYFFVTVDIASDAADGKTIYIDAVADTDFSFSAGTATGVGPAGESFEIEWVVSGLFGKAPVSEAVLFPNPCKENDRITITTKSVSPKLISVYNAGGVLIKTIEENRKEIYLNNLEKGFYMITVQNLQTNQIETKKLVVD